MVDMVQNIRIGFRADANEHIASGHIMRCMSIAKQCEKLGAECIFILAEEKETDRLIQNGYKIKVLDSNWKNLDEETGKMKALITSEGLDFLVVDSYQADACYLSTLNELVPVLYIDDMGTDIYDITAVLHYGSGSDYEEYTAKYSGMHNTDVLAGCRYIPLREEFMPDDDIGIYDVTRSKSIMITTGGTDPYDITRSILNSFVNNNELEGYEFEVIVGNMNQYSKQIDDMYAISDRIHVHHNVTNMSYYMNQCEVAVSAGGTTLFELCACGIPTVCFSFADNQLGGTVSLGESDIMIYAGDARTDDVVTNITNSVRSFVSDATLRDMYSDRMRELVDGRGAARIAEYIVSKVESMR